MKRFYKTATIQGFEDGYGILLDGRPVRTPGRTLLRVQQKALAEALRDEWQEQGDKIEPLSMALTQLTNTAIDRTPDAREPTIQELVRYGETDLLCYRADHPQALVDRQEGQWQPILDWLRGRYDISLQSFTGVLPQPQNPASLGRLGQIMTAYDDFQLTALHLAATSTGSIVIGLAMIEGQLTAEEAADAAQLDDLYQIETWGADEEAEARLASGRAEIADAWRFNTLLRAG